MYNGLKYDEVNFARDNGYNNCYTYAMNQHINPFTKKKYSSYDHCQPGNLGNRTKGLDSVPYGRYDNIMDLVKADLNAIGLDIVPSTFEEYVPNKKCWKVALVLEPGGDYHWYRLNDNGTWSHKMGPSEVRNHDYAGNEITNPELCVRGSYSTFVGFYMVKPKRGRLKKSSYWARTLRVEKQKSDATGQLLMAS